jgi:hypothetical protein
LFVARLFLTPDTHTHTYTHTHIHTYVDAYTRTLTYIHTRTASQPDTYKTLTPHPSPAATTKHCDNLSWKSPLVLLPDVAGCRLLSPADLEIQDPLQHMHFVQNSFRLFRASLFLWACDRGLGAPSRQVIRPQSVAVLTVAAGQNEHLEPKTRGLQSPKHGRCE